MKWLDKGRFRTRHTSWVTSHGGMYVVRFSCTLYNSFDYLRPYLEINPIEWPCNGHDCKLLLANDEKADHIVPFFRIRVGRVRARNEL